MTDIDRLEIAKAEVEWNYPIDYQIALDNAIAALKQKKEIMKIVADWKADTWTDNKSYECMVRIAEVLEDGKVD